MNMRPFFIAALLIFNLSGYSQQAQVRVNIQEIKLVIEEWTDAHNSKDIKAFEKLYAPQLLFYTEELTISQCVILKDKLLNSGFAFHQTIITDPTISVYPKGVIKCDFTKQVKSGNRVTKYEAYLLLLRKKDSYSIIGESDLGTDKSLRYTLSIGEPLKRSDIVIVDKPIKKENPIVAPTKANAKAGSNFLYLISGLILLSAISVFIFKRIRKSNTVEKNTLLENTEIPFAKKKGDEFESFIFERFDRKYFKIIYWQSDNSFKGKSPESNKYPDIEMEFKHKDFFKEFAIECKYRKELHNRVFELSNDQLSNYKKFSFDKKKPVYIALGVGGVPAIPDELYLIPLTHFKETNQITHDQLNEFRRSRSNFFYNQNLDILQ